MNSLFRKVLLTSINTALYFVILLVNNVVWAQSVDGIPGVVIQWADMVLVNGRIITRA